MAKIQYRFCKNIEIKNCLVIIHFLNLNQEKFYRQKKPQIKFAVGLQNVLLTEATCNISFC